MLVDRETINQITQLCDAALKGSGVSVLPLCNALLSKLQAEISKTAAANDDAISDETKE